MARVHRALIRRGLGVGVERGLHKARSSLNLHHARPGFGDSSQVSRTSEIAVGEGGVLTAHVTRGGKDARHSMRSTLLLNGQRVLGRVLGRVLSPKRRYILESRILIDQSRWRSQHGMFGEVLISGQLTDQGGSIGINRQMRRRIGTRGSIHGVLDVCRLQLHRRAICRIARRRDMIYRRILSSWENRYVFRHFPWSELLMSCIRRLNLVVLHRAISMHGTISRHLPTRVLQVIWMKVRPSSAGRLQRWVCFERVWQLRYWQMLWHVIIDYFRSRSVFSK